MHLEEFSYSSWCKFGQLGHRFKPWPSGGVSRAMVHLGWAFPCCEPSRYQAGGRGVMQISKIILQGHMKSMGAEIVIKS